MIYLDNAATTPIDDDVVHTIYKSLKEHFGNPSSTYQVGRDAKKIVEEARVAFASSIHADPRDIIITSGGSESNNTAIIATALALQKKECTLLLHQSNIILFYIR
ncbi:aminotransferase class V-fold PLP-dependent enzyme [Jeotgalibaca sp. MA1X17-3]|uniref:aminotransferase class V-fold PLP-dependent enzyme n=1 Tax=Jeotgalibaca sp. MA1X17-3 TaxID=2908211 RepID=UPI0028830952|nr:aminotransferase class V-fold PLP-dependent enzyme [Jeotgalibaca sp. MA1X17-3]